MVLSCSRGCVTAKATSIALAFIGFLIWQNEPKFLLFQQGIRPGATAEGHGTGEIARELEMPPITVSLWPISYARRSRRVGGSAAVWHCPAGREMMMVEHPKFSRLVPTYKRLAMGMFQLRADPSSTEDLAPPIIFRHCILSRIGLRSGRGSRRRPRHQR